MSHADSAIGGKLKAVPPRNRTVHTETDVGNGLRFVADHANDVRYVGDWRSWCVFDGTRWQRDADGIIVERLAKQTVQQMAADAIAKLKHATELAEADPEDERVRAMIAEAKKMHAWSKSSHDMRRLRTMIAAAKSDPRIYIPVGGDVFDRQPDILNCVNGTIELRTGKLRPHDPADLLTHLVPHTYDPTAVCPRYERFMRDLFPDSPEVAEYVHGIGGYCLTGETSVQAFFVFVGEGSNGKSVLLDIWRHVLGNDLVYVVPVEVMMDSRNNTHPTEKAGFRGARMAYAVETQEDAALNESRIKALTGGDRMSARYCGKDRFEWQPTLKLLCSTNHMPRVRSMDNGIWRRIKPVEFPRRFWTDSDRLEAPSRTFAETDRADPFLLHHLRTEAQGILAAMVQASVLFYRHGLAVPKVVAELAASYRRDEDVLGRFCDEMLVADTGCRTRLRDIRETYATWAKAEGFTVLFSPVTFGKYIAKRFDRGSKSDGNPTYKLRILSQHEVDTQARSVDFPDS